MGQGEGEAMGVEHFLEELCCERENGQEGRGSWEKLELLAGNNSVKRENR